MLLAQSCSLQMVLNLDPVEHSLRGFHSFEHLDVLVTGLVSGHLSCML